MTLPWIVEMLIALALFLHVAGVTFHWYERIPYYDKVLHVNGTAIIALLGFMIVFTLYYTKQIDVSLKMIGIFIFFFAVAVGALWEIAEFTSDQALGTHSQPDNYDTMTDIISDVLGAAIISILGVWYVKNAPEERIRRLVLRIR